MKLKTLAIAVGFTLGTMGIHASAQDYGGGGAEGQQQQQGQEGMGAPEQQQQADFSDQELETFVELQDEIGEVREQYVSEIEAAGSEDEARQLQQEAQTEMVEVIEDAGMSVEEYNAIAVAYNSDPSIQERVDALADG